MVYRLSGALQGQRALLVSPDCLGSLVYLETMETRAQRAQGALLGSQEWTDFMVRRAQRETEASKGKWVYLGERVAHLDLQDPLVLQDRSSINLEEIITTFIGTKGQRGELEQQGEPEPQGQQERRVIREMWVFLDTPPRAKRVSLGSSLDQMGGLCTWVVLQENRVIWGPQDP